MPAEVFEFEFAQFPAEQPFDACQGPRMASGQECVQGGDRRDGALRQKFIHKVDVRAGVRGYVVVSNALPGGLLQPLQKRLIAMAATKTAVTRLAIAGAFGLEEIADQYLASGPEQLPGVIQRDAAGDVLETLAEDNGVVSFFQGPHRQVFHLTGITLRANPFA